MTGTEPPATIATMALPVSMMPAGLGGSTVAVRSRGNVGRVVLPGMFVHMPLRRSLVDEVGAKGGIAGMADQLEVTAGAPPQGFMYAMAMVQCAINQGAVVGGNAVLMELPLRWIDTGLKVPTDALAVLIASVRRGWVDPNRILMAGQPVGAGIPAEARVMDTVRCYGIRTPFTAYNVNACMSVCNTHPDWEMVYPPMEMVSSHSGIYGVIHENTVIDLGSITGTDDDPDLAGREPHPNTRGFLCSAYTPLTKAAGRVRALTIGSYIRIPDEYTVRMAVWAFDMATPPAANCSAEDLWMMRLRNLVKTVGVVRPLSLRGIYP